VSIKDIKSKNKMLRILAELWYRNEKKREFDLCDSWLPETKEKVEKIIKEETGLNAEDYYKIMFFITETNKEGIIKREG
jgi:hypothetical protein